MRNNEELFNQWLNYRKKEKLIFLTASPFDNIFEQIFNPKEQFETWYSLKQYENNIYLKPWNVPRWRVYDQFIKLKFLLHHISKYGLVSPLCAVWNYETKKCQLNSGNGRLQALSLLNSIGYDFYVPLYLTIREQDLKDLKLPYIELTSYEEIKRITFFSNIKEEVMELSFWNSFVDDDKIMRKTPTLPVQYEEIIYSVLIETYYTNYGEQYEKQAFEFHSNTSEFIDRLLPIDLYVVADDDNDFEIKKNTLLKNFNIPEKYFNITRNISNNTGAIILYDNIEFLTEKQLYEFFFWLDLNKPIINFKRYGYLFLNLTNDYFKSRSISDIINHIDIINAAED